MKPQNRLGSETSPYLLSHARNPVAWYPWGPEALARAAAENKPILLSIGYASCHWCHVMERESFQNEEIARMINTLFVPVLVDRDERPDVDATFIAFVAAMNNGNAGWPANLVITPELSPIAGSSYLAPDALKN